MSGKKMWRQELQDIEQRSSDLYLKHQNMQKVVAEAAEFARENTAVSNESGQLGQEI